MERMGSLADTLRSPSTMMGSLRTIGFMGRRCSMRSTSFSATVRQVSTVSICGDSRKQRRMFTREQSSAVTLPWGS